MTEFPRIGKKLAGVETPEAVNDNFETFDALAQGFIRPDGVITSEMIDLVKQKQEPNYPADVPNRKQKIAVHTLLLELFNTLEYRSPNKKRYDELLFSIRMLNAPRSSAED